VLGSIFGVGESLEGLRRSKCGNHAMFKPVAMIGPGAGNLLFIFAVYAIT